MPLAVFIIALLITATATLYLQRTIESNDDLRFQTLAEQVKDSVVKRTDSQIRLLRDTSGMLGIKPDITRDEFAAYVHHAEFTHSYPGLLGIGYSLAIPTGQRSMVEARARAQGMKDFTVHPYVEGQDNQTILYIEPEQGVNERAFGFNMYSDPVRRAAMDAARDQAVPVASAPVKLVQYPADDNSADLLIYMPVYRGGRVPSEVALRRQLLQGFAYSPIRGENLLDELISPETRRYLTVRLFDGTAETGTKLDDVAAGPVPAGYVPRYHDDSRLGLLGRRWTLAIATNQQFDRISDRGILPFVAGIGMLASILLFALSYGQQRARLEAEDTAERLRHVADGQKFLAEAGAILAGSLDYEDTLRKVTQLAVPRLADWCAVNMIEPDGRVKGLAVAHANPAKVKFAKMLAEKYPDDPNSGRGTSQAILTGKTELYQEIPDSLLVEAAQNEEHLELLRKLGMRSAMIVPLIARGRVLGTISMVWAESGLVYTEEDVVIAEQLAARAALAVDNSRLYRDSLQEVHDRQEAEEAVRTLNAELEHRVEEQTRDLRVSNAELEAFSYSVSHDLRAPLRSVSAFASILREDLGAQLDDESRDHLERLDKAARRMGQLIDSLLQYSRLARREIRTERVDLSALAEAISSELRDRYPERKAEIRVQPGICVEADPVLLRVVLENLLENAFKFTGHREMAIIDVGQLDDRDGAFFVRDNGAGFDAQYASKLFRPFERLHRDSEFPGTGIGLANVRRVVERHGGKVWAEGAVDQGATIYFTLPGGC